MKRQEPVLSPADQLRSQIRNLHDRMRDRCLAAGISQQHYDSPLKGMDEADVDTLEALFDWLQVFHDTFYTDMLAIWRLKPADWWQNMEVLFQQRKTREQKLLRTEYKKLRKAWYKRHGNAEEQGQEPVADEAAGTTA